jgi:hypothetical protein
MLNTAVRFAFVAGYAAIVGLFLACGWYLVGLAAMDLWRGVTSAVSLPAGFAVVLRGIGYLTIAVAALELGQTVLEEEVLRSTHMSGPTRARRFLSRFLVVVVVALAVESLIAVFHFAQDAPEHLPHAAAAGRVGRVRVAQSRRRGDRAGVDGGGQAGRPRSAGARRRRTRRHGAARGFTASHGRGREDGMKYGLAWLLGVPGSIVALWFVANQMGCGL